MLWMRRSVGVLIGLLVIGVMMLSAGNAVAATLSWTAPTSYEPVPPATVGDPIPSAKVSTITYTPSYGSSATGPWTDLTSTAAGATSAAVPDPAPGTTRWYSVKSNLDGQTSVYATAVSKTAPALKPKSPTGLSVN
jgi:hypothetical protein